MRSRARRRFVSYPNTPSDMLILKAFPLNSRRQIAEPEKIDLLIVHPDITESTYPTWKSSGSIMSGGPAEHISSIEEILRDRGLVATCIATGFRSRGLWHWEGWVRVPEVKENGMFESVLNRREGCDSRTGEYRLMRLG